MALKRQLTVSLTAAATVALALGGGSSSGRSPGYARYHEPSQGWTARVPAGWASVLPGPAFVPGDPLVVPTRLLLRTFRDRTPAAALRELSAEEGVLATEPRGERVGEHLRWQRY